MSHALQFLMGVTRQPVVQPRLHVHPHQGRLGCHGVQEVQRVRHELAERHGADWIGLVLSDVILYMNVCVDSYFISHYNLIIIYLW